jgi:phage protein U
MAQRHLSVVWQRHQADARLQQAQQRGPRDHTLELEGLRMPEMPCIYVHMPIAGSTCARGEGIKLITGMLRHF